MNLEFALVVFCLTVIALVAIVYGKDHLAGKVLDILKGVTIKLSNMKPRLLTIIKKESQPETSEVQDEATTP